VVVIIQGSEDEASKAYALEAMFWISISRRIDGVDA
jgi:hypothetical protein